MRITERKLRSIIRSVIKETHPMGPRPEGKLKTVFPADIIDNINKIMDSLELKDINFSHTGKTDEDLNHKYYEYVLSALVKNPHGSGDIQIESRSNSIFDFNTDFIENDMSIKEYFISEFMYDFFKAIYQIFYPEDSVNNRQLYRAYEAHDRIYKSELNKSIITTLYNKVASSLSGGEPDFESFISDILNRAEAGTL